MGLNLSLRPGIEGNLPHKLSDNETQIPSSLFSYFINPDIHILYEQMYYCEPNSALQD